MTTTEAPGRATMVLRQLDYWLTVYRRTWKGTAVFSFLMPLMYVGAMGVLLGEYVDQSGSGPARLEGATSYLAFIAPGILAAQAMQIGADESMWPVMGRLKWHKTYYSMIASPLSIADVVAAQVCYSLFRVGLSCGVFLLVLAPFDVYESALGAVVALPVQLLVGLAFVTPVLGYSAGLTSEQGFALIYRIGVVPMFLFSGAFFPISNLSEPLQWLARATPLWHGVELTRMLTLADLDWSMAVVHVAYLVAVGAAGWWWAVRRLTRRLVI